MTPDPPAPAPARILALQLKRIGDAVLTAPALAALRRALPDSRLTLVLAGAAGGLAPAFAMADEVLTWRAGRANPGILRQILTGRADLALDFTGSDRSAFLALLSRARVRAGYARFAANPLRRRAWNRRSAASVRELHTIDFHHALVRDAGVAIPDVADHGHLTIPAGTEVPGLPPEYALVHPGTARPEKFWPAAHWAEVIDRLAGRHGLPVVLTGSADAAEAAHLADIHARLAAPVVDYSGRLSLVGLAAAIAGARIALGPDTAAMHLAAAFRRPQAVLYGPTNPWHWRPRHDRARVVCAGRDDDALPGSRIPPAAMADLPPERVMRAVEDLLSGSVP